MITIQRRTFISAISATSLAGITGCTELRSDELISLDDPIDTHRDSPNWPQVRHDTLNTGHNPSAIGPETTPEEAWSVD